MVRRYSRRPGLTGPEIVVATSIIAILIGLLLPNVDQWEGIVKEMEQSKNSQLRRVGLSSINYFSEFRRFPRGLQEILNDAMTTGKLDTDALAKLSIEIAAVEDDMEMAKAVYQDLMQDKSLTKDERKLVQSTIPIISQLRSELHVIGVLIGLLLPDPGPNGTAGASQSSAAHAVTLNDFPPLPAALYRRGTT